MSLTKHRPAIGHVAGGNPTTGNTQPTRYFRVQGDWEGGGFGYTLPFASAEEAEAWGRAKAAFHRDAVVTVIERSETATEYAQRRARENDARALDLQLNGPEVWS